MSDDDIEALAKALAIADLYGVEADSDGQRRHRERLYDEGNSVWPETSTETWDGDGGRHFVRGKDHWRMLAKIALNYRSVT